MILFKGEIERNHGDGFRDESGENLCFSFL